jgi:hypothetical protein
LGEYEVLSVYEEGKCYDFIYAQKLNYGYDYNSLPYYEEFVFL